MVAVVGNPAGKHAQQLLGIDDKRAAAARAGRVGAAPVPLLPVPGGSQRGRSVFGAGIGAQQPPRGFQAAQMPPEDEVLLSPDAGGCWNIPWVLYKGRAKELASRGMAASRGV